MVRERYETPEFHANELNMFDGIAETCWGYGYVNIRVYQDANGNKQYDDGETIYFYEDYRVADRGHCNEVADKVREDLKNVDKDYQQYLERVSGAENSKSLADSPWQDFIKS
ncbi:MAG: hypothetical protein PUB22_04600 [Clostridiales bacterium]|nr:hypothetical protein [Clostridiales bacterium]